MLSLNDRALEVLQSMIADAAALQVTVVQLDNGATVVDAGVAVTGSLEAGRIFAEVCLAGLGKVEFCEINYGDFSLPGVQVTVNEPTLACMAAQYAGWSIAVDDPESGSSYSAMGSGPARALYAGEPLLQQLEYQDRAKVAVLALENRQLPSARVAAWVAEKCRVSPKQVFLLVAPTASLAGSVQIAARVVETGLHKMLYIGLNTRMVISGFGVCPLAPVARDDLRAIGRTNDAVLYGGKAWYTVHGDDPQLENCIEKLPSSSSKDYGSSFFDLFQRYRGDFYKMDPLLFSPAEIYLNNVNSGRSFRAGQVNVGLIKQLLTQ